jgi:hypothetical protein
MWDNSIRVSALRSIEEQKAKKKGSFFYVEPVLYKAFEFIFYFALLCFKYPFFLFLPAQTLLQDERTRVSWV